MKQPNEAQREAIEFPFDRPLKIVAGPGTGKTAVLTLRYTEAIRRLGCSPRDILALTFSNKAAAEMKERIIKEACQQGLAREQDFAEAFIGTFHSFANRLLKENSVAAALDPGFSVAEGAEASLVWLEVLHGYLGGKTWPQGLPYEKQGFFRDDLYRFILSLKDSAVSPQEFLEVAQKGIGLLPEYLSNIWGRLSKSKRDSLQQRVSQEAEYEEIMVRAVYDLFKRYREALRERSLLDFGDLLLEAVSLLDSRPDVVAALREAFRHILVDEFQDTNAAQFRLLSMVARPNMCNVTVVGDEKQAIYGWRNARVENVEDFKAEEWGGKSVSLKVNYRSYGQILEVAHFSITRSDRFFPRASEVELEPHRGMSPHVPVVLARATEPETEARFVAETVARAGESGVPYEDIALLMRSVKTSAKPFEDALRQRGIPYHTIGGAGFYDRQEVKDILAFLRVARDVYDNVALVRVMQRPPFLMGDRLIYDMASSETARLPGDRGGLYLYDALKASDHEEARRLVNFLQDLAISSYSMSLRDLCLWAIEESGYAEYLYTLPAEECSQALSNILRVLHLIAKFHESHLLGSLDDFLRYLEFSLEEDLDEPDVSSGLNAVRIMTVHQAKGLEFSHVFLVDAQKGRFPLRARHDALHFSERGLVVKNNLEGEKTLKYVPEGIPGWPSQAEVSLRDDKEEERRLWYVALTRAKNRLWVSGSGEAGEFLNELYEETSKGGLPVELVEAVCEDQARKPLSPPRVVIPASFSEGAEAALPATKPDVSLSFSALRTYLSCPRRYRALYCWGLGRLPRPGGSGGLDPARLGRLVHEAIRLFHLRAKPSELEGVLLEAASAEGLSRGEYLKTYHARAHELLTVYLSTDLAESDVSPEDMEKGFHWKLESHDIRLHLGGIVDRVERRPGEIWLVDYKTGEVQDEWEIYCHQMRLYKMALSAMEPEVSGSRMFFLELTTGDLLEVTEGNDSKTYGLLFEVARRLALNEDQPVLPGGMKACRYCEITPYCMV